MKSYIFYFVFLYLFIQANLKLSPEKREELLRKFTTTITSDRLEYIQPQYEGHYSPTISYTVQEIEEKVLNKYQFPRNYDFFNETGCEKRVKDQGRCGSCWSFASTTALSYRYFQMLNVAVDLSPQYGLSCYIKECEAGNFPTDSQMNLIKNGTVTESCFPYTSGKDGSVEKCIDQCKNETEEYKKYYAQNMYTTEDIARNSSNFLDLVTLIIDELITKGPLYASFTVFEDFYNIENCGSDYVYTYDEKSERVGGHGVVIVGYGFQNNKFYWLIQNSWGYEFCDDGFIKIEFGQVGIEKVAFAEPYFHKENVTEKKHISVNFVGQDGMCRIQVKTNSNTSDWVNTLEIRFRNEERLNDYIYHCNKVILKTKGEVVICYYERWNFFAYKGIYKFHSFSSLGDENEFVLDEGFKNMQFNNLGYDEIFSEIYEYYFISDEGSRILMYYYPNREDEEKILPTIYADFDLVNPLSNCHIIKGMSDGFSYVYCDITKEELNYFQDFSWEEKDRDDIDLAYPILCDEIYFTSAYIYRLNKTQYPVFTINDFQFEKVEEISNETTFTLFADIDGNQNVDKKGENYFINFVNIENDGENQTYTMLCKLDESFNITCDLSIKDPTKYGNVYLLPYYYPYDYTYPTELIIQNEIKANIIEPPIPEEEESVEPEPEEEESVEPEPEEEESIEPEPEEEESIEPEPEEEESIVPEPEEEESIEPEPEEEESIEPEPEEEESIGPEPEEEESVEPEPEEEESIEPEPEEEESVEPEPPEPEEEEESVDPVPPKPEEEEESVEPEPEEEEESIEPNPSNKKSSNNTTRTLIIVFSVVGGIIVVGLAAFFIIRCLGRKKINVEDIEKDSASQRKLLDSNELKE